MWAKALLITFGRCLLTTSLFKEHNTLKEMSSVLPREKLEKASGEREKVTGRVELDISLSSFHDRNATVAQNAQLAVPFLLT